MSHPDLNEASSEQTSEQSQERSPEASQTVAALEYWRGLAQIARDEELAELEVERDGVRITLRAESAVEATSTPFFVPGALPFAGAAAPLPHTAPHAAPHAMGQAAGTPTAAPSASPAAEENLGTVVSPMVGMFYRAPSPSDPNFVEVGDRVEVGQTVALVEAMKVFNEITADVAGTVAEIKVESGELVETGQVLITIRP